MYRKMRRLLAASSAIVVMGALGPGVAGPVVAQADSPSVTFSSQPARSSVLAHYTVTPEMRGGGESETALASGSASGVAPGEQLARHSPKSNLASKAAPLRAGLAVSQAAGTANAHNPAAAGGATPTTSASFIGQQGSNITCNYFPKGCNPPDMAIAASPNFVLQGVNTSFEVLSPSGRVESGWPVNSQRFFQIPQEPNNCDPANGNQPFTSDPRAVYDPVDHRFWVAMLQVEGAAAVGVAPHCPTLTVYWIAVSQTANPNGAWNVYEFEMSHGTPFVADFTQFGLNRDAIFFSANMFGLDGVSFYAEVFEANKAQMERGSAHFTADGFFNLQGNGPGIPIAGVGPFFADTVQPMLDLGSGQSQDSGAGHDGWFVDTIDGPDVISGHLCTSATDACKGLVLWRMSNPIAHDQHGPAPTFTGTYLPDTKSFYAAPSRPGQRSGADQPSCNLCVDANDLRIPATPVLRNGTIYTGWQTGIFNGSQIVPGIVWAQIKLGGEDGAATTSDYFNLSGDNAATYPAFMPDGNGNVVMLYEHMGHTTFPEARYTLKRSDQSEFTSAGRVLKLGETNYRPTLCGTAVIPTCRWGDFEATSFDGNGRIWLAGQYANTNTDPNTAPAFGRNWGTWIGAIDTGGHSD
jgi:hypothetical protein